MSEGLVFPEQVVTDIQKAAGVLSNDVVSLAEVARARYDLARHAYSNAVRMLQAPPPPASGEGDLLIRRYGNVHGAAEIVWDALWDLDQLPKGGLRFLEAHAARMQRAAEEQLGSATELAVVTIGDVISMQLMALEARSWVLKAERSVAGGNKEAGQAEDEEQ